MPDHVTPCQPLRECKEDTTERLTNIENDLKHIKESLESMVDIINTWNNGKGFVNTIRVLSKIAVWLGITGAAITGIYQSIKHFGE